MNDPKRNDDDAQQSALPQGLADDLRALHRTSVLVPREVDQAVMAQARQRLGRKRVRISWAVAGAVAALIVIAIGISFHTKTNQPMVTRNRELPERTPDFAREDIDRNGKIDILDAFALARNVESSAETNATWDMTGDGVVDRQDIDHIAYAAVSLNKEAL